MERGGGTGAAGCVWTKPQQGAVVARREARMGVAPASWQHHRPYRC